MRCQRCQMGTFRELDYCAFCLRSMCPTCFAAGCCKHTPSLSGQYYDRAGLPKKTVDGERHIEVAPDVLQHHHDIGENGAG